MSVKKTRRRRSKKDDNHACKETEADNCFAVVSLVCRGVFFHDDDGVYDNDDDACTDMDKKNLDQKSPDLLAFLSGKQSKSEPNATTTEEPPAEESLSSKGDSLFSIFGSSTKSDENKAEKVKEGLYVNRANPPKPKANPPGQANRRVSFSSNVSKNRPKQPQDVSKKNGSTSNSQRNAEEKNGFFSSWFQPTNKNGSQETKPKGVQASSTGATKADPEEVPGLSMWTQNEDGTITGFINNSKDFRRGTKITTSAVPMGAKGGTVVTTKSGSRYRLAKVSQFGFPSQQPKKVNKGAPKAAKISVTKKVESPVQKKKMAAKASVVRPTRAVGGPKQSSKKMNGFQQGAQAAVKVKKVSPPGTAVLSNWKQNPDGSITGTVRNKKGFRDGTKITTSTVRRGVKAGTVVRTSGGSLYELI